VLLFHGTGGDRALVDTILDEGLTPAPAGRTWAHDVTGVAEHVFACTSPVGSKGGDPITFARRRTWRDHEAWLVIVDLPAAAEELVVGAIPNDELERFWVTEAFGAITVATDLLKTRALIAVARARGVACRELLVPQLTSIHDGLVDGPPDCDTLMQFERAYLRAVPRHKARVAASYGVRIPSWFSDDGHYPSCAGCMHNLFDVVFAAPDVLVRDAAPTFSRGSFTKLGLETMGAMLDALGRWIDALDPAAFDRWVRRRMGVPWRDMQRAFPPPRDAVPRTFHADFATADRATRMRASDTQLLLSRVPPEHIAGVIRLGDGNRFAARVRPSGGQTLAHTLWHLANEARAAHEKSGRAVVVD